MDYKIIKNDLWPMITLDQMFYFINLYDLTLSYKRQFVINKWEWYEFWKDIYLELFEILMVLHMENVISLRIFDVKNTRFKSNKKLINELKNYTDKEPLKLPYTFIKDNDLLWKYSIFSIMHNWDFIKWLIKPYDYFDISVEIKGSPFLNLFFIKITEFKWYNNINKEYIWKILYENIIEQTWWKLNYLWKIELFYRFEEDYMKDKRLILPLLCELEWKWNLRISNIKIDGEYIYFELDKLLDLSEEWFIKTSNDIKFEWEIQDIVKIEYTKDWIIINSNKWIPNDSKKSEMFLRVLSSYFQNI